MQKQSSRPRILFMYLGRHGALGRFTHELALAARVANPLDAQVLVSANNELAPLLTAEVPNLHTMPTFDRAALLQIVVGYPRARRNFDLIVDSIRPDAVVNLMPHVWSPLLTRRLQQRGIVYLPVIHDAVPHPGDPTARLTRWLLKDVRHADKIVTLSRSVAASLVAQGLVERQRVFPLFHPDLTFGALPTPRKRLTDKPLRLLFFGRIMAYKGLDVLADAIAQLKDEGLAINLGVAGSGEIDAPTRAKLARLDAEIINRWIPDGDIADIFSRYDAVACAHLEASQSGVAALAFGQAMPVIAMPTGGIVEQVQDGATGVLARDITREALGAAIRRLALEPGLYESISRTIAETAPNRSMAAFLDSVASLAH